LPDGYVIPASATAAEAAVIAFAIGQLDKSYVFGAAGPNAFDCSGLTMAAWAQVGVALPHSSENQANAGIASSSGGVVPGDLILVPGDDGTLAAPGHVGLYIGSGLVLNAADEADGIRVQTFEDFVRVGHGLSAVRHIA
jgi:cell wall-associated NlpC family hydrolase